MSQYAVNRRSPRRKFARPVGILYQGVYHLATGYEIGEGGMSFYCQADFNQADNLVVTFPLPEAGLLSTQAQIVNERVENGERLWAIRFTNVEVSWNRVIRRYVALKSLAEASDIADRQSHQNSGKDNSNLSTYSVVKPGSKAG